MHKLLTFTSVLLVFLTSCSSKPMYKVVYYEPATRQSPPEPVYSRMMWSHLPEPIKPRTKNEAPLLMPEIFVELKNVTVDEAIEAVAQTIGYRWEQSAGSSTSRISIHMEGTVEQIFQEIRRKSNIALTLDHEKRIVKLASKFNSPQLPRQGH
jgi:hypothetical protein